MLASTIKNLLDFTVQLKTIYCHILHCGQFLKAKLDNCTAGEAVKMEKHCNLWDVLFYRGFSSLMGNFFWPPTQQPSQRRGKHWGPCSWERVSSSSPPALCSCLPTLSLLSLYDLGGSLPVMPCLSIPAHQAPVLNGAEMGLSLHLLLLRGWFPPGNLGNMMRAGAEAAEVDVGLGGDPKLQKQKGSTAIEASRGWEMLLSSSVTCYPLSACLIL